jgi:hypothetical protein
VGELGVIGGTKKAYLFQMMGVAGLFAMLTAGFSEILVCVRQDVRHHIPQLTFLLTS